MQDVALDACCLINLWAAGRILSVPSSLTESSRSAKARRSTRHGSGFGVNLHVPAKVASETLYVMQLDEEDHTTLIESRIELQPCQAAGLLIPCDFETHEEMELFVQMATQLGDGEAACFALAVKRGWALATDDRRARRFAAESGLTVITTPELVKLWAKHTHASDGDIAVVLQNIQRFACFTPRPNSPESGWWESCVRKASE